jgi:hypothetical protein
MIGQRAKQYIEPAESEAISGGRADFAADEAQDTQKISIPERDKNEGEKDENRCAIKLTTHDRKFLLDVYQYPASFVTERYMRLGLSARKGNEIQQALLNNGFLTCANISIDRKVIKILDLTEQGRNVLGIRTQSAREGGPVHTYWKHRLADHLKSCGYAVTEELSIGEGKTIDIVAERDSKRIAFEIETGNSDVKANIEKCLEAAYDNIIIVATSAAVKSILSKTVTDSNNMTLLTASEVLKESGWEQSVSISAMEGSYLRSARTALRISSSSDG